MSEKMMVAGGGTGGHIYPAIAIAREWMAAKPGRQVVFVGTEYGLEKTIVPKAGFPLEFVSVGGLKGKSIFHTMKNAARLPLGFFGAWSVISKHRPNVILGVGGYASGPVLMVGAMRGFPTIIHEQNAYPGLTNRLLAKVVKTLAVAFPDALPRFGRAGHVTGNPIRREFFETHRRAGGDRKRLLVFGGSQGSRILNNAMTEALLFLSRLKDRLDIVHQTGVADHHRIEEAYRASAFPQARVTPFIDNMAEELAAADLVVCRAGAMTVGEIAAVGRSAILVPFAAATNNHQYENARVLEAAGGALIITEAALTPERLAAAVTDILGDSEKSKSMGEAVRKLASPDATLKIVKLIEEIQRN
jgi:UDP-N-acetylglucosamine--N-acetylmuramyl-(pentapeptide) pyrophosphoryl-undecaprenol N-acetylglucosamine transferase